MRMHMLTIFYFFNRELQVKIVNQEEQITDYMEKIAAMEEELKRVFLFIHISLQKLVAG